jgi:hypothetical protein
LYEVIDSYAAKRFWSIITVIPTCLFWFRYILSGASQQKRPANRLPHGTLAIRIPGRLYLSKIKGMMSGLYENCV